MRHGPHQGAQKSTTTGSFDDCTNASNASALGTSMGSALDGNAVPQFLHFPASPNATRLRCWHEGQLTMMPRASISVGVCVLAIPDLSSRAALSVRGSAKEPANELSRLVRDG